MRRWMCDLKVAFGRGSQTIPAAVLLLCLGAAPSAAFAATPKCRSDFGGAHERATIVGTRGDDTIRGTAHKDVIAGLGGDDVIRLGRGREFRGDSACGGHGDDLIVGRAIMSGGRGDDVLRGSGAEWGNRGNDRLFGHKGGDNDFTPGRGNDLAVGSGSLPNFIHFENAKRPIRASLAAGIARGQGSDTLRHIQRLIGGRFDDTLIGDDASFNILAGHAGDDTLIGRGGRFDLLVGQRGDDLIRGGGGDDLADYYELNFEEGRSTAGPITVNLVAGTAMGEGTDTLSGIEGASGSDGADTMIGDAGDNFFVELFGGNDTVDLGGGDDFVDGGPGADLLSGGEGSDELGMIDGGNPEQPRRGVTVDLSTNSDSDGDTLSGFEDVLGSLGNDALTGDDGPNDIDAFDGNDTINGLAGNDHLVGGEGKDTIDGGAGNDRCRSGENVSTCEATASSSRASGLGDRAAAPAELIDSKRASLRSR